MNRVRLLPSQFFWNSPDYLKSTADSPGAEPPEPVINIYINERRAGDVTVLDLKGRVRAGGTTVALHRSIRTLIHEEKLLVLLNLSGVVFMDSCGLGELVASQVTLRNKGGELKLVQLTESLRELMEATKLLDVFGIYESESEALRSFADHPVSAKKPQLFFV